MEIRVASLLSSFGATGAGSEGRPTASHFQMASPDVAAGCPALRILGFCRRSIFKLPRSSNPFSASSGFQVPGSPATLFRPSRLSMHHGFPRYLHLPALPAIDCRVAPTLVSFSASVASAASFPAASLFQLRLPIQVPGCPGSCIFRLYRQRIFELPRISRSSAPPVLELSVSLELRSSRLRLPMSLQVSLRASSSGLALGLSPRVSPASLSLGVG